MTHFSAQIITKVHSQVMEEPTFYVNSITEFARQCQAVGDPMTADDWRRFFTHSPVVYFPPRYNTTYRQIGFDEHLLWGPEEDPRVMLRRVYGDEDRA